ncbi:MAG: superoxide dismutase [Ni] [Spirochaetota bacterium]|nr:superoxide dismutase [Ni] [Spirochaetota bacterium]
MKRLIPLLFINLLLFKGTALPHCEVPCGIYDDEMRIHMLKEHIRTIRKSMVSIMDLSKEKKKNYNQIVRWINNKETHANYIQDIVYQYFMAQRIKPVKSSDKTLYNKYINQITLLHRMIVYAMKVKQTNDIKYVEELTKLVHEFQGIYFSNKR